MEFVLRSFRKALPGKPVTWASELTSLGDFDGRDTTVEVFDVPSAERGPLIRKLRVIREEAAARLGAPVRVVFHTPEATDEHHARAREEYAQR